MIDTLLRLSLPALRAITALARGAKSDHDLRAAGGVSRSCVASATRELRELDLIVTTPGRCAAPGVRGIAATHLLTRIDVETADVSSLSLAQARVHLATRGRKYESTSALATACGLTAETTRDALRFLSAHPADPQSTPRNSAPPIRRAPRETVPRRSAQHTAEACSETERKSVLKEKEKEKQQTTVVNFSLFQKLIANGIANDVAAQLITKDENECELQINRLEKLKIMPKNGAGYLRQAITLKYRDAIFESKNKTKESPGINKSDVFSQAQDYRPEHEKLARSVGVPTISDSEKAWQQARDANPGASPKQLFKCVEKILSENAA